MRTCGERRRLVLFCAALIFFRSVVHSFNFLANLVSNVPRMLQTMKLPLLFLLFSPFIIAASGVSATDTPGVGGGDVFRPAKMEADDEYQVQQLVGRNHLVRIVGGEHSEIQRRELAPFQLCLLCKCCASTTNCATMSCCFGIDCHLPNKPFGVCAFVPKTCNCASCSS